MQVHLLDYLSKVQMQLRWILMAVQPYSILIDLVGFAKGGVRNPEHGQVSIMDNLLHENVTHQVEKTILLHGIFERLYKTIKLTRN